MESESSRTWASSGVGRIPEDRHAEGVVGEMAIWENAVLERVGDLAEDELVETLEQALRAATSPHDLKLLLAADGRRGTTMEDVAQAEAQRAA